MIDLEKDRLLCLVKTEVSVVAELPKSYKIFILDGVRSPGRSEC